MPASKTIIRIPVILYCVSFVLIAIGLCFDKAFVISAVAVLLIPAALCSGIASLMQFREMLLNKGFRDDITPEDLKKLKEMIEEKKKSVH